MDQTTEEKMYYNAVAIAMQGDYKKIGKLRAAHGTWKAACQSSCGLFDLIDVDREWYELEKLGIRLLLPDDNDYPPLLREISSPPFGLYAMGIMTAMIPMAHSLAVVGTRRATPEGKEIARRFGHELAQAGFTIVSGLAFGADAAAHEGCMEALEAMSGARGKAIAVLAGGLDKIYPHSNEALARRIIAAGGAIVSEYPLDQPPYQGRFLERNRIISGLAQGTLIVEAPERSGSLVTAQFAFQQNRDLFVVPGPVAHPNFAASHELIRQGATLVTKPEHIMEAYGIAKNDKLIMANGLKKFNGTTEEKLIFDALRELGTATEVDKLADMTRLEPQAVNQAITFLIIKNLVAEVAGGYRIR